MFDGPYRDHLIAEGKRLTNISRSRKHLSATLLEKPIALVTPQEIRALKTRLFSHSGLKQTSIRRVMKPVLAAIALAETLDRRIENGKSWRDAFTGIEDNYESRNVDVIPDADVHRYIAGAYTVIGSEFGRFVETLAHSGSRPSQVARLRVRDLLLSDPKAPRLYMPVSRKGRGQRKVTHQPVAIPLEVANKLKAAAKGKSADALLLPKPDGTAWQEGDHDRLAKKVAAATGIEITLYVLRHCYIVRNLLAGVPARVISAACDTGIQQLERTYSRFILHFSDAVARQGLLAPPPKADESKVVPLR
jgi:integrase